MKDRSRTTGVRLLVLLAATTLGAGEALAQRALGDGDVLDANPRVGSGGRNTARPSFQRELEFRNAIATGNAPGGMSFRGDIGYRAPGEFRGELGSDALFAFRRDSLYSGLAGMGIRGTDALQYQFSMTTGSRITNNLLGSSAYTRLGRINSAADAGARAINPAPGTGSVSGAARDPSPEPAAFDPPSVGMLRSTSAYRSVGSLYPEILSTYQEGIERETYAVIASPLRGLSSTLLEDPRRAAARRASQAPDTRVRTSYDDLLERLRERAQAMRLEEPGGDDDSPDASAGEGADEAATYDWMRQRFEELHKKLNGIVREEGAPDGDDGDSDASSESPTRGAPSAPEIPDLAAPKIRFTDEPETVDDTSFTIDPRTLEILRSSDDEVVTYFIDPDAEGRNIYAEHMSAGARLLRGGRYFDAEERFTSALSTRPGDVPAQIGRLHAQIGAGLVMSGSLNLRALMTEHPELIAQRYGEGLLPPRENIDAMITNLRERIGLDGNTRSGTGRPEEPDRVRLSAGMLLSYLGYQTGDQDQIRAGLRVVAEVGDPSDQRFVHLVRSVWLGLDEPQGAP